MLRRMSEGEIALLAAAIGAGASLLGVLLAQAFKVLTDGLAFSREKDERFRSEKRKVYAEVIRVSDAYREACADIADGTAGWDEYYGHRRKALAAAAELQLVGSDDMNIDYGEALDSLGEIGWYFFEHPELNPHMQDAATIKQYSWVHIGVADRHLSALADRFRQDLGFQPINYRKREKPLSVEQRERIKAAAAQGQANLAAWDGEGRPGIERAEPPASEPAR